MNNNMSTAAKTTAPDAIALLTADHEKTRVLFNEYNRIRESGSAQEKFEIARQVCGDILIHLAIEEAIFYPQVRNSIHEDELMNNAESEHEVAKDLIRKLGEIDPASTEFDEKMATLTQEIEHHVEVEEHTLFPMVLDSGLDVEALGEELLTAKNDMRVNLGLPPE